MFSSDSSSSGQTPPGGGQGRDVSGLGELLKRAREQKGLTLEQIANETRIPKRNLEALECNNLNAVPDGFYRRAQVRAFARSVSLDQELALGHLDGSFRPAPPQQAKPALPAPAPQASLVSPLAETLQERPGEPEGAQSTSEAEATPDEPQAGRPESFLFSRHVVTAIGVLLALVVLARAIGGLGSSLVPSAAPGAPLPASEVVENDRSGERVLGDQAAQVPQSETQPSQPPQGAPEARGVPTGPSERPAPRPRDGQPAQAQRSDNLWSEVQATPPAASRPPVSERALPVADPPVPPVAGPRTQLVLKTRPAGARLTVNGLASGTSPTTLRALPPGRTRIRVSKDGYATQELVIRLAEGRPRSLNIRLRKSR